MDKNRNDKNRIALDMISGVDEELLDKATNRRVTLLAQLARRRRNNRIWLSVGSLAACLCIIFGAIFFLLPPEETPIVEKQIPIYTGMTVSNTAPVAQGSAALPTQVGDEITLLSLPDYNPFAVSYSLKTDNPNANENGRKPAEGAAADAIKDSLTVTGAAESVYYATPMQDLYITVHVDNPDSFEILSFTLNGQKYSSYMFEDGSDMENLILKVNVGDAEGVVEYTIDAIKYVDGTEIKDVRMDGDRTVKVGVATNSQPKATVSQFTSEASKIIVGVTVSDKHALIAKSAGTVSIVLLDGETVIDSRALTVDQAETVVFEGLSPDREYRVAVAAYYDSLDGTGRALYLLYDETIRTKNVMWLGGMTATQTGVNFTVMWSEEATDKILTSFALYDGEEKLYDVNGADGFLTGLLSGHTYRLVAIYRHEGRKETAVTEFTTVAKTAPVYTIGKLTTTQNKVNFTVIETDADNIGNVTKVELLHATEATRDGGVSARSFDGLLSGNEYKVRITYTYDLNDGTGVQTKTVEGTVRTKAKTAPTYTVDNLTATQTKVDFTVTEKDKDNIGAITKIELLHGTEATRSISPDARSFDGLLSGNSYTLKITYTYDLNDGTGVQTRTVTADFATLARTITVTDLEITGKTTLAEGEGTSLKITLNNPDNVSITGLIIDGMAVTPVKADYFGPNIFVVQSLTIPVGQIKQMRIERIDYSVSVHQFSQVSDHSGVETVACVGTATIEDISVKDGQRLFKVGDTVTVIYRFKGTEGYTVTEINTYPATKIDDLTYSISMSYTSDGMYSVTNSSHEPYELVYGFENGHLLTAEKVSVRENICCMVWIADTIIDVSTPEQLQNMNSYAYYRLVNDIDLTGIKWKTYHLNGFLFGNGYEIKNLSMTEKDVHICDHDYSYYWNGTGTLGMFCGDSGSIVDVKLTNFNANIVVKDGESPITVTVLTHNEMGDPLYNCSVEGSITYIDYANKGASIYCIGIGDSFEECSYSGTLSYIGGGKFWYYLCSDEDYNGWHDENISCPSAANTTVYINGVKQ